MVGGATIGHVIILGAKAEWPVTVLKKRICQSLRACLALRYDAMSFPMGRPHLDPKIRCPL